MKTNASTISVLSGLVQVLLQAPWPLVSGPDLASCREARCHRHPPPKADIAYIHMYIPPQAVDPENGHVLLLEVPQVASACPWVW